MMNLHSVGMPRFQGQVAVSPKVLEQLTQDPDLTDKDRAVVEKATPWENREDRFTLNLSEPDNWKKDLGFITTNLIASGHPFAWKPSAEDSFMHAADHKITAAEAVFTHLEHGKPFNWEPQAKK